MCCIFCCSGSLVLALWLARQEHGNACHDGENGEANWQVFESDHGQTFLALGE